MNKVFNLIKKNLAYVILAFCVLAVGLTVSLVSLSSSEQIKSVSEITDGTGEDTTETVEPTEPEVITFIMPIENVTAINDYSITPVFNQTLGRYSSHLGVDFFAEENSQVFCVYDGEITDISTSLLEGTSITVDHGNGLKTIYNSLSDDVTLNVGEKVLKGQVIGNIALSNRTEYKDGAHLHFTVQENGQNINPSKYLDFQLK